jgi:hypothetical protein
MQAWKSNTAGIRLPDMALDLAQAQTPKDGSIWLSIFGKHILNKLKMKKVSIYTGIIILLFGMSENINAQDNMLSKKQER